MSYAILKAAGQQFRVTEGDTIQIPKLDGEPGAKLTFDEVLLTSDGAKVQAGQPTVKGARVTGEILRHGKGRKAVVFKFRRRKKYRKKTGHRQHFTEVKVTDLKLG